MPHAADSPTAHPPHEVVRMRPLGLFRGLVRNPLGFFETAARLHGDSVEMVAGNRRLFLFSHPDLVRAVLADEHRSFAKGRVLARARMVLGGGLLTAEGDAHRQQRRMIAPAFHRARIAAAAEHMVAIAEQSSSRWRHGERLVVDQEMSATTLRIVAKALFDVDVEDRAQAEISRSLAELVKSFGVLVMPLAELFLWLPIPAAARLRGAIRTLDRIVEHLIEERRQAGDRGDLLSMLVHARDEEGHTMDSTLVRDQALTLLLAGHETTANALSWAWWLLARHREFRERLEAEVDGLDGPPTFDDLPRLVWTRAVLEETMRLYPPAWAIGRTAARDVEIGQCTVPKGAAVVVSQWLVHRDPRYFPDPERFDPSRFLAGRRESVARNAYFPFGLGPRACVGMQFALTEGVLLLAAVARHWQLDLDDDVAPVRPDPGITLRIAPALPMIARGRSAQRETRSTSRANRIAACSIP